MAESNQYVPDNYFLSQEDWLTIHHEVQESNASLSREAHRLVDKKFIEYSRFAVRAIRKQSDIFLKLMSGWAETLFATDGLRKFWRRASPKLRRKLLAYHDKRIMHWANLFGTVDVMENMIQHHEAEIRRHALSLSRDDLKGTRNVLFMLKSLVEGYLAFADHVHKHSVADFVIFSSELSRFFKDLRDSKLESEFLRLQKELNPPGYKLCTSGLLTRRLEDITPAIPLLLGACLQEIRGMLILVALPILQDRIDNLDKFAQPEDVDRSFLTLAGVVLHRQDGFIAVVGPPQEQRTFADILNQFLRTRRGA
eukprot:scpid91134/ scgid7593/ 